MKLAIFDRYIMELQKAIALRDPELAYTYARLAGHLALAQTLHSFGAGGGEK